MSHKPSLVRFGALRLPPGFRFHPTDEDLVVQYLKRKVFSCPLPASIIPEIDLGKYNPWNLPGKLSVENTIILRIFDVSDGDEITVVAICRRAAKVVDEEDIIRNDATGFSDFMEQREGDPTPSSSSSPGKSRVTELLDECSRGGETSSPP
ncbi:hypothetical protein B296_00014902 [Ensete ventricosum]|uniref:NAC domain-containing protein n=1 Tax=Ensete ventricosum TaxID=4639 RepID=A0A426XKE1_ENSVE|nr:hypothetical protein B296_00014902 [Ensete ventricosum]